MNADFEMPEGIRDAVEGAAELDAWFGYWPTFHDAEVLSVALERKGLSRLRVHTWHTTSQVDARGYYTRTKHIVVCFVLEKVTDCDFRDFNHQNTLNSLRLERETKGFQVILDPCYGLNGSITAEGLSIELEPWTDASHS